MAESAIGASVLVPVRNEEAHLESTVDAILAQRFDRGFEVLLIDGDSVDRTREIAEGFARRDPRVRVLSNPERRTPNALNVGLRNARGEYVVRMDAHTRYPADYIARGVERLEAGGVDCVCGPPIPEGVNSWSCRVTLALSTYLGAGAGMFRPPTEEVEVDTTYTGVWRRGTLVDHGGWDEGWPTNQDSELCARIAEAGGRSVCLPEMASHYVPRQSLSALSKQYWRYGLYREKTARHHRKGLRRSHLLPPAVAITFALAVLAPGGLGRLSRRALALYGGAVAVGTVQAATVTERAPIRDLVWLPAVFAVMHLSWGAGFLVGCVRFGPPWAGLGGAFGLRNEQNDPTDGS